LVPRLFSKLKAETEIHADLAVSILFIVWAIFVIDAPSLSKVDA
jgi:hypothetical protein